MLKHVKAYATYIGLALLSGSLMTAQVAAHQDHDIVDTAVAAGSFQTLAAALEAADLVNALKGEGPFTVFAPTDDAFGKLPEGTVEELLKPENKQKLIDILTYHVVPGRIYSADAVTAGTAKTLQGAAVNIAVQGDAAMVNNAKLVETDIDASNGVIHVIDTVIMPPADENAAVAPQRMIQEAIEEGAPLYNAGHAGQCARVYMTTAKNLLAMENHGLSSSAAQNLQVAVNKAQQTGCSNSKAWTLRHALDSAYMSMQAAR